MLPERLFSYSQLHSPTYQGVLANHLPMALVAMEGIGATLEQAENFIKTYRDKLEIVGTEHWDITNSNWKEFLGDRSAYLSYFNYFQMSIKEKGIETTLGSHLDSLMPGICASAFHCLIRLGLALKAQNKKEIAIALAFFATEYQALGMLNTVAKKSTYKYELTHLIKRISNSSELKNDLFEAPNIVTRLHLVSKKEDFIILIKELEDSRVELSCLADLSLRLFSSTGSFTALHAVTSCHAFRLVLPYINNKKVALRYYALAILATYISIKIPTIYCRTYFDLLKINDISWKEIFGLALESDNPHKIKMVFSCYEEYKYYKDIIYKHSAELALTSNV